MSRNRIAIALLAVTMGGAGCDSPMDYEDDWLDSPAVLDPSLNDPGYLLSTRPGMTAADRERPVVVAAHGFTASTYEWGEFRAYAEANSDVLVSLVLLGGHGRDLDAFERSDWAEWGAPILEEYRALVSQGYRNVSIAGASTSGALVLEQIASGEYSGASQAPRHFFFIDPIVVPGDKTLTLIPLLRHLVSHTTSQGTEEEVKHWYSNRPTSALAELHQLTTRVRSRLSRGIHLPAGSSAIVFKTSGDEVADPVSALLIYRGLRGSWGERIDVRMFDSRLHVLTRLRGRNPAIVTEADRQRQVEVFQEMIGRARG
jgi:carboxylesterase